MNQFQHKMIVKAHFIEYFVSKQSFAGTRIQTYDLPTFCQDIAFLAGISISPIVHFALLVDGETQQRYYNKSVSSFVQFLFFCKTLIMMQAHEEEF